MYDSIMKRLAYYEASALIALFAGQHLTVVVGPALIILGFGIWNPFVVLAGLLLIRLLFFFCDLQHDLIQHIADNERKRRYFDPISTYHDEDK